MGDYFGLKSSTPLVVTAVAWFWVRADIVLTFGAVKLNGFIQLRYATQAEYEAGSEPVEAEMSWRLKRASATTNWDTVTMTNAQELHHYLLFSSNWACTESVSCALPVYEAFDE